MRRLASAVMMGLVLFWAVVATAQDSPAILFMSDRDGNREIYSMSEDGSDIRRLTNHPAEDTEPAWSPDRRQIAFSSNRDGSFAIFIMNADGSTPYRVSPEEGNYHNSPSWSPDGRRIAYVSDVSGRSQIHVIEINSRIDIQITQGQTWESIDPAWSPNGRFIAFASNQTGNFEIYMVNSDGSNLRQLTDDATADSDSPAWSPNGQQIAFAANGGSGEIYVMSVDGTDIRMLTGIDQGFVFAPSWSPDTQFLLYAARASEAQTSLYRINADGFGTLRLTDGRTESSSPSWAPNLLIDSFVDAGIDILRYAHVNTEYGDTLNLRETPSTNGRILEEFPDGTAVRIIGGPIDSESYRWWQVNSPMGNIGWSVEAADNIRTLHFSDQPVGNEYHYERSMDDDPLFSPGEIVEGQRGAYVWSRPDPTYAEERFQVTLNETFTIIGLPYPNVDFVGRLTWWYLVRPSGNDSTGWMIEEDLF